MKEIEEERILKKQSAFLVLAVICVTILACGCSEQENQTPAQANASASVVAPAETPEYVAPVPETEPAPVEDLSLNRSYLDVPAYSVTRSNGKTLIDEWGMISLAPSKSKEEISAYPLPNVDNDKCGGVLAANGKVQLLRYRGLPAPEYVVDLYIQPTGKEVEFDTVLVFYMNGNGTGVPWLGRAETFASYEASEGGQPVRAGIVLQPSDNFTVTTGTEEALNLLLAGSSNGNVSYHVGIYKDRKLIGAFHARLPTVYETDGRPAEIAVNEEQSLVFDDYESVVEAVGDKYA